VNVFYIVGVVVIVLISLFLWIRAQLYLHRVAQYYKMSRFLFEVANMWKRRYKRAYEAMVDQYTQLYAEMKALKPDEDTGT